MAGRYIISDYKKAGDETPIISLRTDDLTKAEASFTRSAKRKVRSVVLYKAETDTVLKIAIDGEPIYLVTAIEKARREKAPNALIDGAKLTAAKSAAGYAIGQMVTKLAGGTVHGVGGAVVAHFMGPYYAIKGDGAAAVGAGAGLWGGVSGAVIGTIVGGPVGGFIGGIAGGVGAGAGASQLVKSLSPPNPQCIVCKGTGLVDDFRRCKNCNGNGYLK